MAIIGDALRQAFMPKREYESLREEEKAWGKLQRPATVASVVAIGLAIFVSTVISLKIVFPGSDGKRVLCVDRRLQSIQIGMKGDSDSDRFPGGFYLTDQEIADYYWMVVFIPSTIIFALSVVYLVAGMAVAYSAPTRHGCLKVVENNFCASRRGGVRCLSILNLIFAIIFGLLALFLGSSLLTMMSNCSKPLFWCYEIASWGLVVLYGGTAFFLRRKAATILDEGNLSGRNLGLEMLETNPLEVTPEVERRVNEGFKAWMGPSLLSSDEEDEADRYDEAPRAMRSNSNRQRV
ncbi:uncharacterized protein LOC114195993 [Vigna unguiculata]|uniref:Transmembrane protein n=1 Tax=Vigna unguiculata TaxID=3917 RepID=A0A4D6NQI0_VIGUN|nr:uncharacterized protein LOC114195993 [Vigna unguiculata]QCE16093.1 hypothetical protein DEO72_LG11g3106 [Vigna unguiculata]